MEQNQAITLRSMRRTEPERDESGIGMSKVECAHVRYESNRDQMQRKGQQMLQQQENQEAEHVTSSRISYKH